MCYKITHKIEKATEPSVQQRGQVPWPGRVASRQPPVSQVVPMWRQNPEGHPLAGKPFPTADQTEKRRTANSSQHRTARRPMTWKRIFIN